MHQEKAPEILRGKVHRGLGLANFALVTHKRSANPSCRELKILKGQGLFLLLQLQSTPYQIWKNGRQRSKASHIKASQPHFLHFPSSAFSCPHFSHFPRSCSVESPGTLLFLGREDLPHFLPFSRIKFIGIAAFEYPTV